MLGLVACSPSVVISMSMPNRSIKDVADFLTGASLAAGFGLPLILMHTDVVRPSAAANQPANHEHTRLTSMLLVRAWSGSRKIDLGPMFMSMIGGAVVYLSVVSYVYVCHKGREEDSYAM
jgi:hypothetical protein